MAPQFIIAGHPAMGHLITPFVEHLQALIMPWVIPHLLWHVAFPASLLVPCPLLRQGQAKVEHGMLVAGHVPHEDAHLAVVDFAPMPTPLAFDPHRMCASIGKAAGIESVAA